VGVCVCVCVCVLSQGLCVDLWLALCLIEGPVFVGIHRRKSVFLGG
jgi:hypothetical protein